MKFHFKLLSLWPARDENIGKKKKVWVFDNLHRKCYVPVSIILDNCLLKQIDVAGIGFWQKVNFANGNI